MKRRILAFALSALMVLSLCGAMLVSAKPAYAFVKDGSPFTFDNATYQKYKITSGWRGAGEGESLPITVDAVALEFDPADGLIPMAFSGYSGTSAVCAEQYRIAAEKYGYDVVGVINGSFFSMGGEGYGTYGTLVGDLISDGKIASAHAGFSGSVVAFGSDGSMNVVDSSLAYTLSVNGKEIPGGMYYINKTSGTNEAGKGQWKNGFYYYDTSCGRVCDTSEYVTGYEVLCKKLDHTDLIVGGTLRGEVISVTPDTSGGAVGEKDKLSDQFILFVKSDSPNAVYVKDLKAGDSVNIAVEETVEESREIMENANSVITNVGWLVKDGEDLTMVEEEIGTHEVTMMARWTAFGTKPDGSYVFFTTDSVEDEAQYHTGDSYCVTLRDVAKAMMSMGCTNVIRMDGGGSTAMYVKNTGSGSAGYLMSSSRDVGDCILVVKRSSMNRDKTAKADLQALVESLKSDDRTACKEVVAEAKTVLEAVTSTSSDYARAYISVKAVVDAFASLNDMIEAAEKADQKDYAYTIWSNIQKFLSAAKQVRDDKTVGAAAVISAVTSLAAELNKTGDYDVNVAQGCSYKHGTTPNDGYPDTDNKELTDGDWSVDSDGKAPGWVGFGGGAGAKVTIDLGSVNYGLSSFRCRVLKITSWGISFPNSMKVEVSADGENFTSVGSTPLPEEAKSLPDNTGFTFQLDLADGVSARYVRFTVSGSGWSFLSELEVIRHERAGDIPAPDFPTGDIDGDNEVTITDYLMVKATVLGTKEFPEEQKARMDVNEDSEIDIFDYLQIKKIVLEQ